MGEAAEGTDTWKAMLYELHVELKLEDGKHFACRFCGGKHYGIDRINTHMRKTHRWTYPKLGVGKKLPSDIHDWKSICETWKNKLQNDDNFQSKPPSKISRGHGGKKVIDFKVDLKLDRSVIKERAIEYAKFAVPDNDMSSPPALRPIPIVCEIFTPQYVGEESFTAAYVEKIWRKIVSATQSEFESALSVFCESRSAEDAKAVRIKASSECFFLLLPLDNRSWALSQAESVYENIRQYVAELQALKAWQEEQTSKRANLERRRNQIVVAKLLEYDCLQPASDGKDLHAKKLKLQVMLDDLTKQANLVQKQLNELDNGAATETMKGQVDVVDNGAVKGQVDDVDNGAATETIKGQAADNAIETIQGQAADNATQTIQVLATETIQGQAAADDAIGTVQRQVDDVDYAAATEGQADDVDVERKEAQAVAEEASKFGRRNKRQKVTFAGEEANEENANAAVAEAQDEITTAAADVEAVAKKKTAKRKHVTSEDSCSTTGKRSSIRTKLLRDRKEQQGV